MCVLLSVLCMLCVVFQHASGKHTDDIPKNIEKHTATRCDETKTYHQIPLSKPQTDHEKTPPKKQNM